MSVIDYVIHIRYHVTTFPRWCHNISEMTSPFAVYDRLCGAAPPEGGGVTARTALISSPSSSFSLASVSLIKRCCSASSSDVNRARTRKRNVAAALLTPCWRTGLDDDWATVQEAVTVGRETAPSLGREAGALVEDLTVGLGVEEGREPVETWRLWSRRRLFASCRQRRRARRFLAVRRACSSRMSATGSKTTLPPNWKTCIKILKYLYTKWYTNI